jgi:hypothetical protein
MKNALISTFALAIVLLAGSAAQAGVDAVATFEQLKTLEGTWTGAPEAKGVEDVDESEMSGEAVHEFEVSAGGTVVMETMGPGTDHEMINMYHVDGDDLVLTHYCAGGNQPKMRLNREASTADNLVFDFDGGTNLDPETDHYIRSARIQMLDNGSIDSLWYGYADGKPAGEMAFHLSRTGD